MYDVKVDASIVVAESAVSVPELLIYWLLLPPVKLMSEPLKCIAAVPPMFCISALCPVTLKDDL